jgi:hypothetical protein
MGAFKGLLGVLLVHCRVLDVLRVGLPQGHAFQHIQRPLLHPQPLDGHHVAPEVTLLQDIVVKPFEVQPQVGLECLLAFFVREGQFCVAGQVRAMLGSNS